MGATFENFTLVIEKFKVPASAGGPSSDQGLVQLIWNTLLYVVGCSFFAAFIPCITAYVTAKFPFRFSGIVYGIVLITMMIPIVGSYPSELVLLRRLGLYNTMYGIWIQRANFLGMYFLVFHASFKAMSKDFSEAAWCISLCSVLWGITAKQWSEKRYGFPSISVLPLPVV